ncbi:Fur family ferric uptake transcriptional regulator [Rhizobium sp. BK275]|uniref:Fur family transcriptional regulator n=1 Tax=unclassified Rhizobium TaxID=2613769 RepID=UPI00161DD6B4|nr:MULTISPECIES: Fur family transcriptional regulator [unclassified Rhizobium]MBB3390917.1 Fur family ferric uptake transcriptional regulator [Rhizobium sp. BK275]MBB3406301.1 Fur family ferric uptake transcriptional regulator [Rhizobium sp. BK316]
MNKPPSTDIRQVCREHGLRLTGPRKIIMQVLLKSNDHPDAVELHRRVTKIDPGIAIATVYRTLNMLQDKGVLERHTFADGRARYETADHEHHDHLINVETGDVVEFRSDDIERLQDEIARAYGFEIVSHRLEIYVKPLKKAAKESRVVTPKPAR